MSDQLEIVEKWVGAHDELELDDGYAGKVINHEGSRLGTFRDGQCSFGPDDGGVRGEPVRFDEGNDALIVEGSQAASVGDERHAREQARQSESATYLHGSMVEWTGKFAVWPWQPRRPEIDGPIPE